MGDAGIVLSLRLTSPTPAARREDVVGFAVGRELALETREDFGGETVVALPSVFLSELGEC